MNKPKNEVESPSGESLEAQKNADKFSGENVPVGGVSKLNNMDSNIPSGENLCPTNPYKI